MVDDNDPEWPVLGTPGASDQTVPDWGGSDGPVTMSVWCCNCDRQHRVMFTPLGTETLRQSAADPTKILHATHMGYCEITGKILYAGWYEVK